jgi:hypothetical protein
VQEGRKFALSSLFEVGVDVESSDVLAMWLSHRSYRELTEQGGTKIQVNHLSMKMQLEGEGDYPITLDREPLEIPVVYARDNQRASWIFYKDPDNPLLVEYVSKYFRQSLQSVSTAATNRLRWIKALPPVK